MFAFLGPLNFNIIQFVLKVFGNFADIMLFGFLALYEVSQLSLLYFQTATNKG